MPVLLALFLLSFITIRSWSLTSGLFYILIPLSILSTNKSDLRPLLRQWSPALAFIFWFFLSTLWSPDLRMENITDGLRYSICIGTLFLVFSTPARSTLLKTWIPAVAATAALISIILFFQHNPISSRLQHFGKNPIKGAGLYAFFALLAANNLKNRKSPKASAISACVLISALFLTQSRGPILGFIIGLLWIWGPTLIQKLRSDTTKKNTLSRRRPCPYRRRRSDWMECALATIRHDIG